MIRRQTEFNEVNLATAIFRLASQGAEVVFARGWMQILKICTYGEANQMYDHFSSFIR